MAVAGIVAGSIVGAGAVISTIVFTVREIKKGLLTQKEMMDMRRKLKDLKKRAKNVRVEEEFERVKLLGSGGFGEVWKWREKKKLLNMDIFMAVKEVSLGSIENSEMLLDEGDKMILLKHENVVDFYGSFVDTSVNKVFLFMELLVTSVGIIARRQPISEGDARILTRDIMDGLIYIHEENIIHCDIKGDNILLDREGKAKIGDLGISKHCSSSTASSTAVVKGSLPYMSPELLSGEKNQTRSDLWAVGCTVLEMLHQYPPFKEDKMPVVITKTSSLKHRDVVQKMDSNDLKDFLLSIFVKLGRRPYPVDLRRHRWLPKEGAEDRLSTQFVKRVKAGGGQNSSNKKTV